MKTKMQTEIGECLASIKTTAEIEAIQTEITTASWLPQTLRWVEAVKDPTRFKIVYLLYRHDHLCGCDLANILEVSQSAVSQHLRKLKDMSLVTCYRHKQTLFYALSSSDFLNFLSTLLPQESNEETNGRIEICT